MLKQKFGVRSTEGERQYLLDLSNKGDRDAQYVLGSALYNGTYGSEDINLGLKWLTASACAGSIEAAEFLAAKLSNPSNPDYEASRTWFRQLLAWDQSNALAALGAFYLTGHAGVEKNTEEYVKYYLWWIHCTRIGSYEDCKKEPWINFPSDDIYRIGRGYYLGDGIDKRQDYAEALKWFRIAANAKYTMAQLALSYMNLKGEGLPIDLEEALIWYYRAEASVDRDAPREIAQVDKVGDLLLPATTEQQQKAAQDKALPFKATYGFNLQPPPVP